MNRRELKRLARASVASMIRAAADTYEGDLWIEFEDRFGLEPADVDSDRFHAVLHELADEVGRDRRG